MMIWSVLGAKKHACYPALWACEVNYSFPSISLAKYSLEVKELKLNMLWGGKARVAYYHSLWLPLPIKRKAYG